MNAPRKLLDLAVTEANKDQEIAYDIADKLQEEKSDLIRKLKFDSIITFEYVKSVFTTLPLCQFFSVRIVKIVGFNICNIIYEETKQTEANGGMLIMVIK